MCKLKYIIFDDESFAVFPARVPHSAITAWDRIPIAAGMLVGMPGEGFTCAGDSATLGLKCREEDTKLINKAFEGATFPEY
jgi:hypothetical protein